MPRETIVIDLDDTICFPDHSKTDSWMKYMHAKPNYKVIRKMQDLHDNGIKIIIHSARRMLTHKGDIEKIEKDVGEITKMWLALFHVPYDELIFGKPYASMWYVDDKAMSIDDFLKIKC